MAVIDLTTAQELAGIMNEALVKYFGEGSYQIDTTSTDTIEGGFKAIGAYPPEQKNAILAQVNLILIYRNYGTMFTSSKNPTRRFWRDAINYGDGEADIYQEILEPVEGVQGIWASDYADKTEEEIKDLARANAVYHFKFHKGKVTKKFHTRTNRKDFAISVSEHEISKAFTPEGFAGYVNVKIANLQWSAEVDILRAVIECVRQMVTNGDIIFSGNHTLNNHNGVTEVVETLRTYTDAMTMIDTKYNKAGILTMSDRSDLYLLTTPEFLNRISVRGSANAFNINEYRNENRVITLPSGTDFGFNPTTGEPVYAVLLDRRAIVMAFRYWSMRPFVMSGTDWQNYFLKIEYLYGYNEFFNGVAFSGENIDDFFTGEGGTLIASGSIVDKLLEKLDIVGGHRVYDADETYVYQNVEKVVFLDGINDLVGGEITVIKYNEKLVEHDAITPMSEIILSNNSTLYIDASK